MTRRMLATAVAAFLATQLAAVTVGSEWCVAYPESGPKGVIRALRITAQEVRDDINEATGWKLKALPASKATSPAIWIGAEFAERAGFDLSGLRWYSNVIAEKNGNIYLFGCDKPGRNASSPNHGDWFRCILPSVRAATRFLETSVGVRFLMPGEVGKEVPKCNAISLADGAFLKESPAHIYGSGRSRNDRSLIFRIANGIWGMGVFHSYNGHTYPYACPNERYFKDHPEYFAERNGKRMLGKTKHQTALCISNPEVEELIVNELKRQFDMGADGCQLAQNDGAVVCECDKCRAMYGTGDDWGEKFWLFHRHIAERMLKDRPGKIVHILSYGATQHPPKTFKVFPSNVMVEMCSYDDEAFREWEGYIVPHGFTVYTYLSGNYMPPGLVARHSFAYLAQLVRRFRENGVKGLYRCDTEGDLYGTEGPGYYIYNKLLIDGSLAVNELLVDYCTAAFGSAAGAMKRFYDAQDERLRMFDRIYEDFASVAASGLDGYVRALPKNPLDLHGWMFSPDAIKRMESALSSAERTSDLSAKQRTRIKLVRLEFDYAKFMGGISTLYAAYRLNPTKESISPLLDLVGHRNDYLDRLFGGEATPKRLEGWPELEPFGPRCTRNIMNANGRGQASIGAPLAWPVDKLGNILPGASVKRTIVTKVNGCPSFDVFKSREGWNGIGGIAMEKVPLTAKFKVMYDDLCLYVLVESDLADDVVVKDYPLDGPVWEDECVDVLLAPGDTRDVYYHFIWSGVDTARYDDVTGLITNPLYPGYGKADSSWNGKGWKVKNRRDGGKWRTIATFPYSDFGVAAPKPREAWFINVGRIAKTGVDRKDLTLMLWSPNVESRSMVAPNAMGKAVFRNE